MSFCQMRMQAIPVLANKRVRAIHQYLKFDIAHPPTLAALTEQWPEPKQDQAVQPDDDYYTYRLSNNCSGGERDVCLIGHVSSTSIHSVSNAILFTKNLCAVTVIFSRVLSNLIYTYLVETSPYRIYQIVDESLQQRFSAPWRGKDYMVPMALPIQYGAAVSSMVIENCEV
jgi:hypothetical protein